MFNVQDVGKEIALGLMVWMIVMCSIIVALSCIGWGLVTFFCYKDCTGSTVVVKNPAVQNPTTSVIMDEGIEMQPLQTNVNLPQYPATVTIDKETTFVNDADDAKNIPTKTRQSRSNTE